MEPALDKQTDKAVLLQYIAQLEKDNAKLRKINNALIYRVESGMADNGNSFTIFQVSAELEKRIQERNPCAGARNQRSENQQYRPGRSPAGRRTGQ